MEFDRRAEPLSRNTSADKPLPHDQSHSGLCCSFCSLRDLNRITTGISWSLSENSFVKAERILLLILVASTGVSTVPSTSRTRAREPRRSIRASCDHPDRRLRLCGGDRGRVQAVCGKNRSLVPCSDH